MNLSETADLLIHLRLKDDATGAIKGAQTNMAGLNAQTTKTNTGFAGLRQSARANILPVAGVLTAATTAGVAAGEALKGFGEAIGSSIAAAAQEQVNIQKMNTALDQNITSFDGNTKSIEINIAQREKLAFSDDDLRDSLAQLVPITHDVQKGLDAQRVAMDLARFKSISLKDATGVVGKVLGGNVGILRRYGIAIGNISDPLEAMAALQKVVAGQAEAFGKTTTGQLQSLAIAAQDADEAFGQHLEPSALRLATAANTTISPALGNLADTLGTLAATATGTANQVDRSRVFQWIPQAMFDIFPQLKAAADQARQAVVDEFLREDFTALNQEHLNAEYKDSFTEAGTVGADAATTAMQEWFRTHHPARVMTGTAFQDGKALGQSLIDGYTQGLIDEEDSLSSAVQDIKDAIKNGLTPKQLEAEATGRQLMRWVQRGLNSEKPKAVEAARGAAGSALKAIVDTANNGVPGGKSAEAAGKYLAGLVNSGIEAKELAGFLAGQGLSEQQIAGLKSLFPQYFNAGWNAADRFNDGFNAHGIRRMSGSGTRSGSTSGSGGTSGGTRVRQFGGPVNPYGTYVVGEAGAPELLTMGSRGGWVTPLSGNHPTAQAYAHANASASFMRAQPIQVTVLLNTRTVARELAREGSITYARTR